MEQYPTYSPKLVEISYLTTDEWFQLLLIVVTVAKATYMTSLFADVTAECLLQILV